MQNVTQVLTPILQEAKYAQTTSTTLPALTVAGAMSVLEQHLNNLWTTGGLKEKLKRIGSPLGATGADGKSLAMQVQEEPRIMRELAEAIVGECLMPSVRSWLIGMESAMETASSVGYNPPAMWHLNDEERANVHQQLEVLNHVLTPSYVNKGGKLAEELTRMFAMFPFGLRHDKSHVQIKIDTWCSELEKYPFYAVKIACKWNIRRGKEPSFYEFEKDVKEAVGLNVLERQKNLRKLLAA